MHKILTLILAAALLAGCAQHSAPLSLHARADAPHQAAAAHITQRMHRTHLTRIGCMYLRERLGLPALGSPPPAAPGISDAQPSSPESAALKQAEAYIAAHTNCAQHAAAQHQVPSVATRPRPPAYTPPQLTAAGPAAAAFYPQSAQRLGEQGTAIVDVCVGPNGRLTSTPRLVRSSGSPRLDRAALRYARATSGHWRTATRGARAVRACTDLPVRFSMLGF